MESCSLKTQRFDDVTWYQVPNSDVVRLNGKTVGAYWAPTSNSIVLAGNGMMVGDFVRHEMLHAIIRKSGHPREDFIERCGGAVTCASDCVREAGPGPNPDTVSAKLPSDSLLITVSTQPALPSKSVDDGFFTIVVSARNPGNATVAVSQDLTDPGFSYTMSGPLGTVGGGETIFDPGRTVFAPGETKVKYFDLQVGLATALLQHTVAPGLYTLVAGYNKKQLRLTGVRIGP